MRDRRVLGALATAFAFGVIAAAAADPGDPLKRRGFLGAAFGEVTAEIRRERELGDDARVVVQSVVEGTAAAKAGLKAGDVVVRVNGGGVKTAAEAVARISAMRRDDVVTLDLVRDAGPFELKATLGERPRETSDGFETEYGSVTSKAGRLRTIVTRPRGEAKRPAVLFVQGIGCTSVEGMPGRSTEFQEIAAGFTRRGFVTLRVDKPGCGDSEGRPCEDVDFETELDGYRQALKMLKADGGVDDDNVFVFGHSLGGLWAPRLAAEIKVKGVAVYGTVFSPWFDYEVENRRRQLVLGGKPKSEVDAEVGEFATALRGLYLDKKSPEEVAAEHPGAAAMVKTLCPDGKHVHGRSLAFLRQVAAMPIAETWGKVDAHVLALWGMSDFVSTEADHRKVAEVVNKARAGRGRFLPLFEIDHGFHLALSAEESFAWSSIQVGREFNPLITETLVDWAEWLVTVPG